VLDNIDKEVNWSSYVIRSAFLIVLACHIPYIFFSGKESLLIMIEETRDRSMSTALEQIHSKAAIGTVRGPDEEETPEEDESELKKLFRDMKGYIYYPTTLSLYAVQILGAIVI